MVDSPKLAPLGSAPLGSAPLGLLISLATGAGEIPPPAGWARERLTPEALHAAITTGLRWIPCHLKDGHRNTDDYEASNCIVLDIDGDIDLDEFQALPFVIRHCLSTFTTRSHGSTDKQKDKGSPSNSFFRAIFYLSKPLDSYDVHAEIALHLVETLDIEIQDECYKIAVMPFRGNEASIHWLNSQAEPLPWDWETIAKDVIAARLARRQELASRPRPDDEPSPEALAWIVRNLLRPSSDGERLGYWNRIYQACAGTKDDTVFYALSDWHSSGHHKSNPKPRQLERDFWNPRTGRNSGGHAILSEAAAQNGSNWRDRIPENLRWWKTPQPANLSILRRRNSGPPSETSVSDGGSISFSTDPPKPEVPVEVGEGAVEENVAPTVPIRFSSGESDGNPTSLLATRSNPAIPYPSTHEQSVQSEEQSFSADELFALLYEIRVKQTLHGENLDPVRRIAAEHAAVQGLMESSCLYSRDRSAIDAYILGMFQKAHGGCQRTASALRPLKLSELPDDDPSPILPGLILTGETYLMHGKPGSGKTSFSLALSRAVVGTPGHRSFLGFTTDASAWGQRRVLLVASDGHDAAGRMVKRYAGWMNMLNTEWANNYLDILASDRAANAPPWRMDLSSMDRLALLLDLAHAEGRPYNLVIFDSLKAICPPGIRVGDQVLLDYIEILTLICRNRDCAQLFLHHTSKDTDNPQGIASLEEITSGNLILKTNEQGQRIFRIYKNRAAGFSDSGPRDIAYSIRDGLVTAEEQPSPEIAELDAEQTMLRFFQSMRDSWIRAMRLAGGNPILNYPGISRTRLPEQLREHDYSHAAWTNDHAIRKTADSLLAKRLLERRGNGATSALHLPDPGPQAADQDGDLFTDLGD